MLLVFTADELERLAGNFSAKKPLIEFLGANQFSVKISRISIRLSLLEVQPRKLRFSYKMNAFIHFFAERLVNLNKPGLNWDKKSNVIELNFDQMPQDEKLKDFFLRQMIIDEEKMIIDFDQYQKMDDSQEEG